MASDDGHSPIYRTLQALEDEGLHVHVAQHIKKTPMLWTVNRDDVECLVQDALNMGAKWVSIVVVSDAPQERVRATEPAKKEE